MNKIVKEHTKTGIKKSKVGIKPFTNYEDVIVSSIVDSCCYYLNDTLKRKSEKKDAKNDKCVSVRGLYQLVWQMFKLNGIDRDYPSIKTHLHRCLKSKFLEPSINKMVDSYKNNQQPETQKNDFELDFENLPTRCPTPEKESDDMQIETEVEKASQNQFLRWEKQVEQQNQEAETDCTNQISENASISDDSINVEKQNATFESEGLTKSDIVMDNIHYLNGQLEKIALDEDVDQSAYNVFSPISAQKINRDGNKFGCKKAPANFLESMNNFTAYANEELEQMYSSVLETGIKL